MDESLLPSGDGSNDGLATSEVLSASQASLQRSTSLLERIRAQRERESTQQTQTVEEGIGGNVLPESSGLSSFSAMESTMGSLPLPNYSPIANDAFGNTPGPTQNNALGMSSVMSLNFSQFVRGLDPRTDPESAQGLLAEEPGPDGYSMTAYFRMFVTDVYTYFRSLAIPLQAFIIVILLWLIWKLL